MFFKMTSAVATLESVNVEETKVEEFPDVYEVLLIDPQIKDVRSAVEHLESLMGYDKPYKWQKIKVVFEEEVEVRKDRRNVKKLTEMKVNFFNSNRNFFCYTFHRASGFPVSSIPFRLITSLSIEVEKTKAEDTVAKILNRRHPNAWTNLDPKSDSLKWQEHKTVSIKSKFPSYVIEELKDAFDNKKDYSHKKYGQKRDLSVETKLCDDGVFRAWYSSEYAGCGNGSYYLLLNPTTAAFREDD